MRTLVCDVFRLSFLSRPLGSTSAASFKQLCARRTPALTWVVLAQIASLSRASRMALFTDEELSEMSGVIRGPDFIEVTCGCTSRRYGDAVGKLRVFASGELEIICDCIPGCQEGKLSPSAFEKHSGREGGRRWKINIWVIVKGVKVPLLKTVLLKYHDKVSKSINERPCHRDEFIHCTMCQKERRFRLRTKGECRVYHDALADQNWKCSDLPDDKTSCDDEEERASRRVMRGCTRAPSCNGCTRCFCFGCDICRFSDCSCQTCVEYMKNAAM